MLLGLHRLHQDECLYSAYAIRMVTHGDISMNGGLGVDKPPLFFYAIAASFLINGISENAARLPNIIFSLLAVFYLFRLARLIYRDRLTPLLSAFFAAFSVMFTIFSVTAFQDISMTAFMVISFYYLKQGRHFKSGIFYAVSIACKPMTLFLLPLYIAFIIMEEGPDGAIKQVKNYAKAFAFVFVPLVLWSALLANPRWGMFTFFIKQQPEAMQASNDIAARLGVWIKYSGPLLNGYYFLLAAVAGLAAVCAAGFFRKDRTEQKYDLFFLACILFTYFIFSFLKFRQYDRYVVVLVPFLSLALARTISFGVSFFKDNRYKYIAAGLAVFIYIIPMRGLPDSKLDMGALFSRADGFERVASYVKHNSGQGTQLIYFGHALAWYGYFYLSDEKFYRLISVFNKEELRIALDYFKGRNLIVVDSRDRAPEEIVHLKNNFRLAYPAADPGTGLEKFLVFENLKKTP